MGGHWVLTDTTSGNVWTDGSGPCPSTTLGDWAHTSGSATLKSIDCDCIICCNDGMWCWSLSPADKNCHLKATVTAVYHSYSDAGGTTLLNTLQISFTIDRLILDTFECGQWYASLHWDPSMAFGPHPVYYEDVFGGVTIIINGVTITNATQGGASYTLSWRTDHNSTTSLQWYQQFGFSVGGGTMPTMNISCNRSFAGVATGVGTWTRSYAVTATGSEPAGGYEQLGSGPDPYTDANFAFVSSDFLNYCCTTQVGDNDMIIPDCHTLTSPNTDPDDLCNPLP